MEVTHVLQTPDPDGGKPISLKVTADKTVHTNTRLATESKYGHTIMYFYDLIRKGTSISVYAIGDGSKVLLDEDSYHFEHSRAQGEDGLVTASITLVTGEGLYFITDKLANRYEPHMSVQRAIHTECDGTAKIKRAKLLGHELSADEQKKLDKRIELQKKLESLFK